MTDPTDLLSPRAPQRPFRWPEAVYDLRDRVPDPAQVYLVGGCVRDALLGRFAPGQHDLDLATGGDALELARRLGNALGGAYFPLDAERGVGRVIAERHGEKLVLDVARFRGDDLRTDLTERDFTVNAMAISLAEPDMLIDPLGGEDDLLRHKVLRLCTPEAIASDPIRALRAVRMGLQFHLRLHKETLAAVRADGMGLVDETEKLVQPERVRDELVKMLSGHNPAGAARLLDALGMLDLAFPSLSTDRLDVLEQLAHLLLTISPRRSDNTAANLTYGMAVMILDRHRAALQEHLGITFADGRPLRALLALWVLTKPDAIEETVKRLRFSNAERDRLVAIGFGTARILEVKLEKPPTLRAMHRYFQGIGEAGIDAALLALAAHLAEQQPTPDPKAWAALLDETVSPLLEAFFRRHQQVIKPPPLLTGDDLMNEMGLKPGPQIGQMLERLLEEQAAGEISSREEALSLARRWLKQDG
jgi:tRNA nucleotidyltransferase/poly(A) polymerase